MQRVTVKDLQRVARKWLGPERLVLVGVGPGSAKKPSERTLKRAAHLLT
jgi:predicted Zn-dependent peptidase